MDEEEPKPQPRRIRRLAPVLGKYKLFRTMFQRNGRSNDDIEEANPNLNVDGIVPADPSGVSASSIIPEHPGDLIFGHMFAPRPVAPPPPPPQHRNDVPGPSRQLLQPPAPVHYYPNLAPGHFAMETLGQPSSSAAPTPTVPSPPKRRRTIPTAQPRPPPLRLVQDDEEMAVDLPNQPTPPPEAGATASTSTAARAAASRSYLATRNFAKKTQPCVSEVDSPMDTTPPRGTPPVSPMDFSGPSSPTAPPAPVVPQPAAQEVARRLDKIFKH